jgi:IstB-like ATP binding protein
MGGLPLPQDHRRFRLHLPVDGAPFAARLRPAPDFVTEGRCLILTGKPGRGKTHLAVAIAYRAIQNGFDALFVTAAELIDDLSAAFREGRLAVALTNYTHPALLVVDEVGYLTYGTDAANMLFHGGETKRPRLRHLLNRPEFPEFAGQSLRNLQTSMKDASQALSARTQS